MIRYYFDLRDGDELAVDEEGIEMPDLETVQFEAVRSLADMAKHTEWTKGRAALGHRRAIEVRDDSGPVLQVKFTFDVDRAKH